MSRRSPGTRWLVKALPVVALLVAGGCSSVMQQRANGGDSEPDEVGRLKDRVIELQRQARMNEVEIARLRRQVSELSQKIEGVPALAAGSARPAPPPARTVEESMPPPVALPPAVDLQEEDLAPPAIVPPAASEEESPLAPSVAPVSAELTADGQALYDRGYTLYHQALYVDAESSFQSFLQGYAGTDLADNAQFWIGEARLRRGDLNGALAAFRETVDRFPSGNKVPDALFRTGDCLEQLGDLDGARAAWNRTIERFPSSAAAALSEERLAAIP